MEQNLYNVLEEALSNDFIDGILSNSTNKEILSKVKLRPVKVKEDILFQITEYRGKQVFHSNLAKKEAIEKIEQWLEGTDVRLRQAEFHTRTENIVILISKKGKAGIRRKKVKDKEMEFALDLSHNRKKQYILTEDMELPFLQELGVMTKEGKIVRSKYDKFRQINRFLEFVEDVLPSLEKEGKEELTIIDFGCGKSYLTFAMYYYLCILKNYKVKMIGLDLKKDVIAHCQQLSETYGYENLVFLEGDIASYDGVDSVDMVVSLHACDTATDYALEKAVEWGAKVILSVPCCHHELNQNIACDTLGNVLQYGVIKERTAALFTDALRANVLELCGYQTQILEFIDMEHTPKNLLIRAVKNGGKVQESRAIKNREEPQDCKAAKNIEEVQESREVKESEEVQGIEKTKEDKANKKMAQKKKEYDAMVQLLGCQPLLGKLLLHDGRRP